MIKILPSADNILWKGIKMLVLQYVLCVVLLVAALFIVVAVALQRTEVKTMKYDKMLS